MSKGRLNEIENSVCLNGLKNFFSKNRAKAKIFTLVELLIVIAIMAVMISFFSPVFKMALSRAKEAICLNNIRQLSAVFTYYTDDCYKFPVPYIRGVLEDKAKPWGDYSWNLHLVYMNYMEGQKLKKLVECPESGDYTRSNLTTNPRSYSMNCGVETDDSDVPISPRWGICEYTNNNPFSPVEPYRISKIVQPGSTFMLIENFNTSFNTVLQKITISNLWEGANGSYVTRRRVRPSLFIQNVAPHSERRSYSYVDGHAVFIRSNEDLLSEWSNESD